MAYKELWVLIGILPTEVLFCVNIPFVVLETQKILVIMQAYILVLLEYLQLVKKYNNE
jgi:hypothetical protein